MRFEELPEDLQDYIIKLKHVSWTLQSDVFDDLDSANTIEEFRNKVDESMNNIIGEAKEILKVLGNGKLEISDTWQLLMYIAIP